MSLRRHLFVVMTTTSYAALSIAVAHDRVERSRPTETVVTFGRVPNTGGLLAQKLQEHEAARQDLDFALAMLR